MTQKKSAAGSGRKCPRCYREAREAARFCARCGLVLETASGASSPAGSLPHPGALPVPAGYSRCVDAPDLHHRWESASGGACIGAEPLAVYLFNAGYALADVRVELVGRDEAGQVVFRIEQEADELPQGKPQRLEVPSYEVSRKVAALAVRLLSAEFLWQD